ncbi:LOW QUALITY PROTEIN: uncharacterized protein LOC102681398 [Apis dorsata]|uniref:LOW QUALITY PROTEIN: uncharacterized protein LOC102681398 n=1 Tax=Apis dorsata TaxID=7462 RepID=UPI001294085D|nr:LOW QUALITY PROTEIN: uncharacterized protein LOC102681398 [Apis dorsata]
MIFGERCRSLFSFLCYLVFFQSTLDGLIESDAFGYKIHNKRIFSPLYPKIEAKGFSGGVSIMYIAFHENAKYMHLDKDMETTWDLSGLWNKKEKEREKKKKIKKRKRRR